jgi:YceI-like domain
LLPWTVGKPPTAVSPVGCPHLPPTILNAPQAQHQPNNIDTRSILIKMSKRKLLAFYILVIAFLLSPYLSFTQSNPIQSNNGKVVFTSEATLELIKATSGKLKGAMDKSKNTFAFSVDISTFKGFNSDLQREHFFENYVETDKFPTASFSGKIIEPVDFSVNGTYEVRAKGFFTVHGISKERIIKGTVIVKNGMISIGSVFMVRLEDHDIRVPKIVYEKIAEEIKVEINIQFKQT